MLTEEANWSFTELYFDPSMRSRFCLAGRKKLKKLPNESYLLFDDLRILKELYGFFILQEGRIIRLWLTRRQHQKVRELLDTVRQDVFPFTVHSELIISQWHMILATTDPIKWE